MSKILVAEDNLANRELLREILESRGHEVIEACDGQDALFASLRVVAVTAFAMQGNREQVLAAGFDGYLSKPIDIAALTKELREFLG
ncbi:MAG: hypothetical protein AUG83_04035 [Acidobacteria bacterium 13_1_20CM_4_57_11]|nr:MAG: hypothetical protein AUG83_04035 [Acidobacteria bacterium 13_1_20CM_4_57_11]